MSCNCMTELKDEFAIELVQGDYGSFLYDITDANNEPLNDVDAVIFTCARLKTQINLSVITSTQFSLTMDSNLTSQFTPCTSTYDITILFKGTQSPVTLIHNAGITILKKENKLNVDSE